ncbi:MAG TPA: hypothetical protein VH256_00150 [Thermoleophilaceae bacterium]|nr:hypothetical protein [Thermoleophilaceae bacterium]
MTDAHHIPISQDAALVIALAGTAIPFARSAEDEAERWLRALRLHGEVGRVMQALGVSESSLSEAEEPRHDAPPLGEPVLERVTRLAASHTSERDGDSVGTEDLLHAVLEIYGDLFEHVLYIRGTSGKELFEHVGDPHPARSAAS